MAMFKSFIKPEKNSLDSTPSTKRMAKELSSMKTAQVFKAFSRTTRLTAMEKWSPKISFTKGLS